MQNNNLEWFLERIGKRVYRPKTSCNSHKCTMVYENGLVIEDKQHAQYLFDIQNELGRIYYFDNPQNKL